MGAVELNIVKKENFEKVVVIYLKEFSRSLYNENWTLEKIIKLEVFLKYCDIWKICLNDDIIEVVIINPNHRSLGKIAFCGEVVI